MPISDVKTKFQNMVKKLRDSLEDFEQQSYRDVENASGLQSRWYLETVMIRQSSKSGSLSRSGSDKSNKSPRNGLKEQ